MFLAVPAMIRMPASSSFAFKSLALSWYISSNCFLDTLPTLSWLGRAEPLAMFAAFLRSTDAGGDLRIKVKLLSEKNRDYYGKDHSILILGSGVEVLTKRHDVDALSAESRPHRRSRICSTGRKLEADVTLNFLSHFKIELNRVR